MSHIYMYIQNLNDPTYSPYGTSQQQVWSISNQVSWIPANSQLFLENSIASLHTLKTQHC